MTKEQMMDDVISRFGFESKVTIGFCKLVIDGVKEDTLEYWHMLLMDAYEEEDDFDECRYMPI